MNHESGPGVLKLFVPVKPMEKSSRSAACARRARTVLFRACCVGLISLAAVCGGCTRKYWREQADDLSYDIIKKKEVDPRWTLPRIDVMADPRSRFYDPYDPDFTPLPPDDPAAHDYMHWIYGMNGYRKWHDFGDLPAAENPDWLQPFGLSQDVVATNYSKSAVLPQIEKLTLEEAVELSWVHSRDYQTQVENVYLVALALTLQRFQFDLQFVGFSGRPSSEVTLEDTPGTGDSVNWNNTVGVRQLFPSGAQFIAELANNTLWLFSSGGKSDSTASVFSYSLVQPLLANSGRRFVMEGLTQAERNMLYAIRDLARYRMGFFTTVVAGGTTAGLTSGVTAPAASAIAALTTPTGGIGYLDLLQQMQVIYNQEYNISQLKEQLDRIHSSVNLRPEWIGEDLKHLPPEVRVPDEDLPAPANVEPVPPDGKEDDANKEPGKRAPPPPKPQILKEDVIPPEIRGQIKYNDDTDRLYLRGTLTDAQLQQLLNLSPDLEWKRVVALLADLAVAESETVNQQLTQLQTQLAQNCISLRTSRVNLLNSIDQFKLTLGLPPDMPITIDDSLLKPFEFIDARLLRLQDRLKAFVPEPPEISATHPDAEAMRRAAALMSRFDPAAPDITIVRGLASELELLQEDIRKDGVNVLEDDFVRYAEHVKAAKNRPASDNCFIVYRDEDANSKLKTSLLARFNETVAKLDEAQEKLKRDDLTADEIKADVLEPMSEAREEFLKLTRSLSVVQINVRVDLIDLSRFDLEMDESVAIGLENRMDLMNARAQVMDARRNVEVAANQLQAVLNIVAAGDIRTQPLTSGNGNPLDFRGDQSSLRAGVQFTSPVQLVQQRNVYRAALISYQRARRNYMRIEDQVKFDIRTTWRPLNLLQMNFETAREQVRAAAAQLDISSELNSAPVIGAAAGAAGGSAQGLNTLQALSAVLNAQNQMIQIWVNFETNRLQIYNFMGTMEIDENGFWVDEFYRRRADAARAGRSLDGLPPTLPSDSTPPSTPQELQNEPVDATEIAPQPHATDARSPNQRDAKSKRDPNVQIVKGETWPERPDPALLTPPLGATRGGRKAAPDPVDPPRPSRRGRVGMEREESVEPGRAKRPDRRSR